MPLRGLHVIHSMINTPVVHRFNIEDLIVQDSSGVAFRALDTETGETVALRRFFPFGPDGGGLQGEEQIAYDIAVSRLAGLNHPALRSIICGGCDPIDGMPFIATEWIEGESLDAILEKGPIPAEAAAGMISELLEVCELLSHVLAEEAVWVDTELHTIFRSNEKNGHGFTFWISPLKWLGGAEQSRGLHAVTALAEEVTGWKNKPVSDQAGRGFGGWVKWLRKNPSSGLSEARETLAAAIGANPPPAAKSLVVQATGPLTATPTKTATPIKPATPTKTATPNKTTTPTKRAAAAQTAAAAKAGKSVKPASLKRGWLLGVSGSLLALVLVIFFIHSRKAKDIRASGSSNNSVAAAGGAVPEGDEEEDVAQIRQRASELRAQAAGGDKAQQSQLDIQKAEFDSHHGVFPVNERELLVRQDGNDVTVEGVLRKIDHSLSGKTMYLQFYAVPGKHDPCVAVFLKNAPADLSEQALTPLMGRKLHIKGTVQVRNGRPDIKIKDRASIKIIE